MKIFAAMAQVAEHVLGKDEVTGSNPVSSSNFALKIPTQYYLLCGDLCIIKSRISNPLINSHRCNVVDAGFFIIGGYNYIDVNTCAIVIEIAAPKPSINIKTPL